MRYTLTVVLKLQKLLLSCTFSVTSAGLIPGVRIVTPGEWKIAFMSWLKCVWFQSLSKASWVHLHLLPLIYPILPRCMKWLSVNGVKCTIGWALLFKVWASSSNLKNYYLDNIVLPTLATGWGRSFRVRSVVLQVWYERTWLPWD